MGSSLSELPPLSVLIAYPYMTAGMYRLLDELSAIGSVRWLVDSGAFTAWKSGRAIALDEYMRFLREAPVRPWRYINLDVIGDGPASERNYHRMREAGLEPVPVFTRGEDLAALDRYYETSDLVALGGLVSRVSRPKPYLKYLHQHLLGRRYHILGFTSLDWLKYLKPYSVDSTSWERAAKYGTLNVYLGRGQMATLDWPMFRDRRPIGDALIAAVRRLGFDAHELYHPESWRGTTLTLTKLITTTSWILLSIEAEKHLGTTLFLAHAFGTSNRFLPACYARALRVAGYAPKRDPEPVHYQKRSA